MFTRAPAAPPPDAVITVDGVAVACRRGEPVATVLLRLDSMRARVTPSGAPRGPYCLIGACFECLVIADGGVTRRACLLTARDGMRIERHPGRLPA
jgi:hypothetical protein